MGRPACVPVRSPARDSRGRCRFLQPFASGFTLTELMVVVVLVGILAVVAVPVYDRYIRHTKGSEARAMIGAIVAAEKAYAERNGAFVAVSTPEDFMDKLKIDIRESGLFDYVVSGVSGKDRFTVTATVNTQGVSEGLPSGGTVVYRYDRSREPRGEWQENL
jgi:type IV pilus assembly protein PilE